MHRKFPDLRSQVLLCVGLIALAAAGVSLMYVGGVVVILLVAVCVSLMCVDSAEESDHAAAGVDYIVAAAGCIVCVVGACPF